MQKINVMLVRIKEENVLRMDNLTNQKSTMIRFRKRFNLGCTALVRTKRPAIKVPAAYGWYKPD